MGLLVRWALVIVCAAIAVGVGQGARAQLAATPCHLPYTFENNTTADAVQVNANLSALQDCLSESQGAAGIDPRLYGLQCGANIDNTAPLQTPANLVAANGGGRILIPCQIAINGTLTLGSSLSSRRGSRI